MTHDSNQYTYFHSDFGVAVRTCHTMDCMKQYDLDGMTIEDGCGCDRTLPIVCVHPGDDGLFPELVDTFEGCGEGSDCRCR